eukprot:344509-Rhodomonas_salina.2
MLQPTAQPSVMSPTMPPRHLHTPPHPNSAPILHRSLLQHKSQRAPLTPKRQPRLAALQHSEQAASSAWDACDAWHRLQPDSQGVGGPRPSSLGLCLAERASTRSLTLSGRIAGWLCSDAAIRARRHASRRRLSLLFTSTCPAAQPADVKLGARRHGRQ